MKKIYLDHAATTPVDEKVKEAMMPYFSERYGNSSSLHTMGRDASNALENARDVIRKYLNAKNHKIVFCSGGTESVNHAIKGTGFANRKKGKHIITTSIEHECVLNSCRWLEKQGFDITYLPVDREGFVDLGMVEKAIRKDTILVSVIHGNNEIGTIQDIDKIGKICKDHDVYFHVDACQSFTKVPINLKKQNIDLLTINSHKIYGPKGVGALVIKEGTDIDIWQHGGGHESGLRSGTVNVPGIVGFSKAVEIADKKDIKHMTKLRDMLIDNIKNIEESYLNGPLNKRLCNNANFRFSYIEGEALVMHLDSKQIYASTGSACSSKSLEPSHVLIAIGLKPEEAHSSLRLSLGKENTKEDIRETIDALDESVKILRKISPFR